MRTFRDQEVVEALWPECDSRIAAWFQAWPKESPQGTVSVLDERTLEVGEELFRAASPPELTF